VPPLERDDNPEQVLASLGSVTEDLRATVEEKLYEIVEAAEARAHEIEDRALEQALELEQDAERKAAELFQSSSERAEQLLVAIDSFEREIREAVRTLRRRGAELAAHLEEAEASDAVVEGEAYAEAMVGEEADADALAEAMLESEADAEPVSPAPDDDREEDPREGIRKRILDLFLAGRPRADAEQLLGQIEDGGRYIDLLDEIYESRAETQQGSRRRRGGRRRRRPGP
jgi:hypothetical protein